MTFGSRRKIRDQRPTRGVTLKCVQAVNTFQTFTSQYIRTQRFVFDKTISEMIFY